MRALVLSASLSVALCVLGTEQNLPGSNPINVITANTASSQEEMDVFWNGMEKGCRRALFFEGTCDDEMGRDPGTAFEVSYRPMVRYWPHGKVLRGLAADFNGTASLVDLGSGPDIDNLQDFTIAFWTFCRGTGSTGRGTFFNKLYDFSADGQSDGHVGLSGRVFCADRNAYSQALYPLERNEWHHVAFVWEGSSDRKIRIYVDTKELAYTHQQAGMGIQTDDAPYAAYIGSRGDGGEVYDGMISTFFIYDRALSQAELHWLAHDLYHHAGGDLRVTTWEKMATVDPARISNGMVCFYFDDAYTSQYTKARPILESYGLVGNVSVISNLVGMPGRLTPMQLKDLIASGWEIMSHSRSHPDFATLTEDQARAELAESRVALESLGTVVRHFSWPYGAPQASRRALCAEYYDSAIGTADFDWTYINVYSIGHVTVDNPGALTNYKGYVDKAYRNNRLLMILMHDLDEDDARTLTDLIEYIQSRPNPMPVLTMSQALERLVVVPPEPLWEGSSIRLQEVGGSAQSFFQTVQLEPGEYVVCFLTCTDGSEVTSSDVRPFAGTGAANVVADSSYEHRGGGVYLCWGTFLAVAGEWNVGIEVGGGKTVYIALPTCYAVAATGSPLVANTIVCSAQGLMLCWCGAGGFDYEVQFADSLLPGGGTWRPCAKVPGRDGCISWCDFGSKPESRMPPLDPTVRQRYYMIRQLPLVMPSPRRY